MAKLINNSPKIKELKNLGLRVYKDQMMYKEENGKVVQNDEQDIIDICNLTFGTVEAPVNPTTNKLELFNAFLVEVVEEIAEPTVKEILGMLADFEQAPAGSIKMLKYPTTTKPKWLVTAKGTGVDLVRLSPSEKSKIATPSSFTYGGYYEFTTFRANPVKAFRDAVDKLVDAKIDMYFEKVYESFKKAVANAEIPDANIATGTDLNIDDFQKVESTMIRLGGGRPQFIADSALITHFANKMPVDRQVLMTDELRNRLREDLIPTMVSKTLCTSFYNPFIDEENSKVKFEPDMGFFLPANGVYKKPFVITEYGATRQYMEFDNELEQVNLKIVFEANITLLNTRYVGAIIDDSITIE